MRSTYMIILLVGRECDVGADIYNRLRQTDVKAGHFERKVQVVEKERDQWEQKYEEMAQQHQALKKQLEDFQAELGSL